ncbi:MAG: AAA family ATPase, partial [Erysipelotrichaceae bacterium]|nr:AAA family ATPase [Erysipelotrichaceae bacterium]
IVDLTLDTGLGKDSLSVISQGNIQAFAEAKPIERRALFEEAAGVAKYKKRKNESVSKLLRTQDNIDRMQDVVNELEKQVAPLKRQAHKAQLYQIKKARLTEIEVAVIVNDIRNYLADLDTMVEQINDLNYQDTSLQAALLLLEKEVDETKEAINNLDNETQKQQDELLKVIGEIQVLERRKVEVDERRKYIRESGNDQAKIEQTKIMLDEALFEYRDRENRLTQLEAEIELLNQNISGYGEAILHKQEEIDSTNNSLNYLINRKSIVESQIQAPFTRQAGVKAVLEARRALPGIYDAVTNLFTPDEGYQLAISTALGGALYHIVTDNEASARAAIRYLKDNKSGRATFLPMSVIRPHYVNKEHLFVAEHTDGFLGLASDFVDCEEKFDGVLLSLLGNVLVTDNLKNANELAIRLKQQYNIVTLEGDVVHRGGSMTGGFNKQMDTPMTLQSQLEDLKVQINDTRLSLDSLNNAMQQLRKQKDEDEDALIARKIQLASLSQIVAVKRNKYENLKEEYDRIKTDGDETSENYVDNLVEELNATYARRDMLANEISTRRSRRVTMSQDLQRKEIQLRQRRGEAQTVRMNMNNCQIEKTRLETMRDNQIERLSREYHMTFEYASGVPADFDLDEARQEVLQLRQEITDLGHVNLDAPQDYEEVNDRYSFMVKQLGDLQTSKDQLLQAINDMDKVMTVQFREMFTKINRSLNDVFTVLFGGGRARLILEDPDDILNTGIDIDVQPPGKNIQNIRLFSGGEKSLIAICVLFAILKARPMPLCIFDEVEASLDQGNVDRFARYIHQFSDDSQFIVITHRPGTMTECNTLFGITMPQQGVSKVIKVKLKEALKYVEEEDNNGTVQ